MSEEVEHPEPDKTDRMSCITHLVPMEPITEQSTVTVLVASSLCCCMLLLAGLAVSLGYLFLMFWGIFILEDNDGAADGTCDTTYTVWEFCFFNELFAILVTTCGCFESGRLYKQLSADDSDGGSSMVDGGLK